jgi:glycosyltransferase involved in cell wall biosynthesis
MNVVIFAHPAFMASQSMPRFAEMVQRACLEHGLQTEFWSPRAIMHWLARGSRLEKWAGYIDQYLIFPLLVSMRVAMRRHTLYVFCDQALGPWVPLVAGKPHVIHVHDFLALKSALGLVQENPTSATGRLYQRYIRWGFKHGRNFISVSQRTENDLKAIGEARPERSHVVYNGLNYPYQQVPLQQARQTLRDAGIQGLEQGFVMHIGGSQWYKNKFGVVHIYQQYAASSEAPLPLLLIGPKPAADTLALIARLPASARVLFAENLPNKVIEAAYSAATALLFPSHAEGFGWPIVEAQACGCPVITTDDSPMNEIGGAESLYVSKLKPGECASGWARQGAQALADIVRRTPAERASHAAAMRRHAAQFSEAHALAQYIAIYDDVYRTSPH